MTIIYNVIGNTYKNISIKMIGREELFMFNRCVVII